MFLLLHGSDRVARDLYAQFHAVTSFSRTRARPWRPPGALAAALLDEVQPNIAHTIRTNEPDDDVLWIVVLAFGGAGLRVVTRAALFATSA